MSETVIGLIIITLVLTSPFWFPALLGFLTVLIILCIGIPILLFLFVVMFLIELFS